jgi:hypothetical protein
MFGLGKRCKGCREKLRPLGKYEKMLGLEQDILCLRCYDHLQDLWFDHDLRVTPEQRELIKQRGYMSLSKEIINQKGWNALITWLASLKPAPGEVRPGHVPIWDEDRYRGHELLKRLFQ